MSESRRRSTPLRRRLTLMFGATLFGLLLAEGLCRAWGAATGRPGPAQFLVHDPRLGWCNRPGFAGRHSTEDFDVSVRFDDAGRRRGSRPTVATDASPLVLAIGDSTTFGWGVEEEETFAARLRDRVGANILNLGVTGYGSDQQLLLLRRALATLKPQLVLVTHTPNDVGEVLHVNPYRRYKPRFLVRGGELRLTGVPVPHDRLAESSHLWRTILKHVGRFEIEKLSATETATGRDLVVRIYREIRRECASRGVEWVLAAQGSDWLRQAAAREKIRFLDLSPTFARLAKSGPIRFEHDPHWQPRLHDAVAGEFARFIEREGLLGN